MDRLEHTSQRYADALAALAEATSAFACALDDAARTRAALSAGRSSSSNHQATAAQAYAQQQQAIASTSAAGAQQTPRNANGAGGSSSSASVHSSAAYSTTPSSTRPLDGTERDDGEEDDEQGVAEDLMAAAAMHHMLSSSHRSLSHVIGSSFTSALSRARSVQSRELAHAHDSAQRATDAHTRQIALVERRTTQLAKRGQRDLGAFRLALDELQAHVRALDTAKRTYYADAHACTSKAWRVVRARASHALASALELIDRVQSKASNDAAIERLCLACPDPFDAYRHHQSCASSVHSLGGVAQADSQGADEGEPALDDADKATRSSMLAPLGLAPPQKKGKPSSGAAAAARSPAPTAATSSSTTAGSTSAASTLKKRSATSSTSVPSARALLAAEQEQHHAPSIAASSSSSRSSSRLHPAASSSTGSRRERHARGGAGAGKERITREASSASTSTMTPRGGVTNEATRQGEGEEAGEDEHTPVAARREHSGESSRNDGGAQVEQEARNDDGLAKEGATSDSGPSCSATMATTTTTASTPSKSTKGGGKLRSASSNLGSASRPLREALSRLSLSDTASTGAASPSPSRSHSRRRSRRKRKVGADDDDDGEQAVESDEVDVDDYDDGVAEEDEVEEEEEEEEEVDHDALMGQVFDDPFQGRRRRERTHSHPGQTSASGRANQQRGSASSVVGAGVNSLLFPRRRRTPKKSRISQQQGRSKRHGHGADDGGDETQAHQREDYYDGARGVGGTSSSLGSLGGSGAGGGAMALALAGDDEDEDPMRGDWAITPEYGRALSPPIHPGSAHSTGPSGHTPVRARVAGALPWSSAGVPVDDAHGAWI